MKSLHQQIQQIEGLVDTKDVNEWENGFIKSIAAKVGKGHSPLKLSEKQVAQVEKIYKKHFGDMA